jgi:hypothetical protein
MVGRLTAAQALAVKQLADALEQSGKYLETLCAQAAPEQLIDDPIWAWVRRLAGETLVAFGESVPD